MDSNFETENSQEIERLHRQLASESETGTGAAAQDDLDKTQEARRENGAPLDSSEGGVLGDVVECEETLRKILAAHADGVRLKTAKDLLPIAAVEPVLVDRIAENAGMSEGLQKLFSHHGAKILSKYRAAKYVSDGGAIAYGILAYLAERAETKRDIATLLKKYSSANGAQPAKKDVPRNPVNTLNMEQPPVPKIST